MSDAVISAQGLSKRYRIGDRRRATTLREWIIELARAPLRLGRRSAPETIWALKDVSFEIAPGEVVGVIGRNGAGKSTLLKILARITEPTEGRAEVRGRVGSLLEVGTGFHSELTGRENIFLNGAILGMKRAEILAKFDEIVAFAEVEKFIDTPVKHYSSGMYLRLAFAVAAHLEPEILLVDEVLAVGDASFQKKCLGKMGDVARQGRTVLFVSHNMAAVVGLCLRALMLEVGRLVADGAPDGVVHRYVESSAEASVVPLADREDRTGDGSVRLTGVSFCGEDERPVAVARLGVPLLVGLDYRAATALALRDLEFEIGVYNLLGELVCLWGSAFSGPAPEGLAAEGRLWCGVPELPLSPGVYSINVYCGRLGKPADWVKNAAQLQVIEGDFFGTGRLPPANAGAVMIHHHFRPGSGPGS